MPTQAYLELQDRLKEAAENEAADGDSDLYNDIRDSVIFQSNPLAENEMQAWAAERVLKLEREELTELSLSMSLCPMHFRDYAICFDDEDPECEVIRLIHPAHDT